MDTDTMEPGARRAHSTLTELKAACFEAMRQVERWNAKVQACLREIEAIEAREAAPAANGVATLPAGQTEAVRG